jgi:hypothetical protein
MQYEELDLRTRLKFAMATQTLMYTKEVARCLQHLSIFLSNSPSPVISDFETFHNGNPPP